MNKYQHTIKKAVRIGGVGLHSGKPVKLTIRPAKANSGIRFVRTDINPEAVIPAFMTRVVDTCLATTISQDNVSVATTEHLLAALNGLGIDNASIELDGPEVPIMDGSAGPFVHILKKVHRRRQKCIRKMVKVTKEIIFQDGDRVIRVLPYNGMKITCEIDFMHDMIRKQSYSLVLSSKRFAEEIANARTFGFLDEVEKLQENGLALGGSLDNAIVMDNLGVMNEEGLRYTDEFVRHKLLDIVGDLALLGCPLVGHVVASKTGHTQHLGLLNAIAAHPECWEFVKLEKNGKNNVLEHVVTTTKAAGNMILPFFVPPQTGFAGKTCPA